MAVAREPFAQFEAWFEEATKHDKVIGANLMCLATASADGLPSARMVTLNKYGPEGFTFFTNYGSRKAIELDANHRYSTGNHSIGKSGWRARLAEFRSKLKKRSLKEEELIGAAIGWNQDQSNFIKGTATEKVIDLGSGEQLMVINSRRD